MKTRKRMKLTNDEIVGLRRERVLELMAEGVDQHEANAIARREYPANAD